MKRILFEVEEYECHISTNCIVIHAANTINSTNDFNLLEHHDVKYKYKSFIRLVNVCEKRKSEDSYSYLLQEQSTANL